MVARALRGLALRRWGRSAAAVAAMAPDMLRLRREEARQLRTALDAFLHAAEARIAAAAAAPVPQPLGTDWTWRPEIWSGPVTPPARVGAQSQDMLGSEATLFHDCTISEITLRQIRNTGAGTAPQAAADSALEAPRGWVRAGWGLRAEVFRFDGSFFSVVLDLPESAVAGLAPDHLVRLNLALEMERWHPVYARLNIRHGPNSDALVRELPMQARAPRELLETWVEFDLAYTRMNPKRVEKVWLDLIFDRPAMNQILLRDLTMSRHPRAAL